VKDWVPLSRRGADAGEAPYRGVPAHLVPPLMVWLGEYETHEILRKVAMQARVPYQPYLSHDAHFRLQAVTSGLQTVADQQTALLDVVEGILYARVHEALGSSERQIAKGCAESLDEILALGGSHWRVNTDHLEARVDDAVREAVEQARNASKGTSASTHLRDAWAACYGRNPVPGKAYSEAIKAVESASAPVVSPKNSKATLGTILGDLRANPGLWQFAIAPGSISPVIDAMSTLWDGQTDRHGGVLPTAPIAPMAEEAALLLAATLVHWFARGAVKRR
jgi:hypothetical protein